MKRFRHELLRWDRVLEARAEEQQRVLLQKRSVAEAAVERHQSLQRSLTWLDERAAAERTYARHLQPLEPLLAAQREAAQHAVEEARRTYLAARAESRAIHELLDRARARHRRACARAQQRRLDELATCHRPAMFGEGDSA